MQDATRQRPPGTALSCPHAHACPGCPLIGLGYAEQCEKKRTRVSSAISSYPTLASVEVAPSIPAEPIVGYRVRAKLIVGPGPSVGLYERGRGHRIVDIPQCLVLAPLLRRTAEAIRRLLQCPVAEAGAALIPYADNGVGALTALDLRVSTDGSANQADGSTNQSVLLTLVLDDSRVPAEPQLIAAAAAIQAVAPWVAGVAVNRRAPGAPQVLGPSTRVLAGAALIRDHAGEVYQLSGYGAFVQAHPEQARALRRRLREAFEREAPLSGQRVVDVYGGSGAIGLDLAKAGAHVTMIESFAPAAENALAAAREQAARTSALQGAFDVRVGDAAHELRRLTAENRQVDAVVINPPRRGVDSVARRAIVGLAPKMLAYVSCNPDSLARDLDHFARLGYRTTHIQPFDMIPLTEQVESLAMLAPAPLPPAEILYEDDAIVVAAKGPDEPIEAGQGYPVSFVQRIAAARWKRGTNPTRGAAVPKPVVRIASGASGALLMAFDPRAIQDAIRSSSLEIELTYTALVRGIPAARGQLASRQSPASPHPNGRKSGQPGVSESLRYERIERLGRHALLAVRTGIASTDALRTALARIAHPVVGDERWGHAPTNRHMAERHGLSRLFLHCAAVSVRIPGRAPIQTCSALWPDLAAVLASLRSPDPR